MNTNINRNETITDICNSALASVGHADFIEDIQDSTPTSAVLRVVLEQVCREVQSHEFACWDELQRETQLVKRRDVNAKESEWNLPLGMIHASFCRDSQMRRVPFEIFGGHLRCPRDFEGLVLRHSAFSFNPSEWSTELKTCVIHLLSARVVASLVKDYASAQKLENNFWNSVYPHWAGCKKNKARQNDYLGNDAALSGHFGISGEDGGDNGGVLFY